jgi:hypothetical protein
MEELMRRRTREGDETVAIRARLLAGQNLPGLIVVGENKPPKTILPGTQVLRMALPTYCQDRSGPGRVLRATEAGGALQAAAAVRLRE